MLFHLLLLFIFTAIHRCHDHHERLKKGFGSIVMKLHRMGCVVVHLILKLFNMATVAMVTMKVRAYCFNPIVMKLHRNYPWDVHTCIQGLKLL